jgi:4-hydroxybenzoyl-CoA thioesterase/acyl-CoA thioester hydrolase
MAKTFRTSRRVEFRDTDAAGIVHFTVFFAWMEAAEHEFLRHLRVPLFQEFDRGRISWPRVAASCNFLSPLRFEETVNIEVHVEKLGGKSVRYGFRFRCDERPIAQGTMTSVCCHMGPDGVMRSVEVLPEILEKLAAYVA